MHLKGTLAERAFLGAAKRDEIYQELLVKTATILNCPYNLLPLPLLAWHSLTSYQIIIFDFYKSPSA